MFGFEFANPKYFLLLILLVPMIVWYILKEKNRMLIYSFLHYRRLRGSNIPADLVAACFVRIGIACHYLIGDGLGSSAVQ